MAGHTLLVCTDPTMLSAPTATVKNCAMDVLRNEDIGSSPVRLRVLCFGRGVQPPGFPAPKARVVFSLLASGLLLYTEFCHRSSDSNFEKM